ncbi:MAG: hypothetical protein JSS14_00480 [Proteobacteria bacterium]|nr:hypothetical protein [Pseudomonadota bacterium]
MTESDNNTSFGVYKPVGHVVISFPSAQQAQAARAALAGEPGLQDDAIRFMTDRQMVEQVDADILDASPLVNFGQELNLVKAHRELAQLGYHWLIVRAEGEQAVRVAAIARQHGAERAQRYGRLVIEELIEHGTDLPQVSETPDRGLDAQTPSGQEGERAALRPAEKRLPRDAKR